MIDKVLPDHKTLAGLGTGQPRIADIPEKVKNKVSKQFINRF
jgi:hypothetical protein